MLADSLGSLMPGGQEIIRRHLTTCTVTSTALCTVAIEAPINTRC